jgi:hypothetical protein
MNAAVHRAELRCGHTEIDRIVRQDVAGRRLNNDEGPAHHEQDGQEDHQRPAVADPRLHEAAIVPCQKSLAGRSLLHGERRAT